MSDANRLIQLRIEAFTAELTRLVRDAAIQAVAEALELPAWKKRAAATAAGKRRSRRTASQLAVTSQRLLEYVEQHPGLGVEAIARALSVPTKALTLPIRRLVAAGKLTASGQKRAARYRPASKQRARRASTAKKRAVRPARRTAKHKRESLKRTAKARRKR